MRQADAVDATNSLNWLTQGGYFDSGVSLKLNKTFCPEHGLIALFVCARTDPLRTTGMMYPVASKEVYSDFYTPEHATRRSKDWYDSVWHSSGTTVAQGNFYTPMYEEYRKGININATPPAAYATTDIPAFYTADSDTADDYRAITASDFDTFFRSTNGSTQGQFSLYNELRLIKNSPVPRAETRPLH